MIRVVQLLQDGWEGVRTKIPAWCVGGAKMFRLNWERPRSYFRSLVEISTLVDKGVATLPHGEKDAYYLCLLRAPESQLVELLALCHSLPDAEAKAQLNRALKDEFAGPEDDPVPADADGDTLPALADEEGLVVQHVDLGHRRCMVDMGNDPPSIVIKLYFDNSTHQSGRPRGWMECSEHSCIRYRFVDGQSKEDFAAEMYAWRLGTVRLEEQTKQCHLNYAPTIESIAWVTASLRLRPF